MTGIPDYGKLFEKKLKTVDKNKVKNSKFAPYGDAFRWCICGASGTGKTTLMIHALLKYLRYEKIYLYCRDLNEPCYRGLMLTLDEIAEENELDEPLYTASEDPTEIIKPEELDGRRCVIVFDDMITAPAPIQRRIAEHFIRSRKKNASLIYLTQSYYALPRNIRLNCSCVSLMKLTDRSEIDRIANQIACDIPKKKFVQIYKDCVKERFGFIMYDMVNPDIHLKYRCGFEKPLIRFEGESESDSDSD
jgi:hypothetical protein